MSISEAVGKYVGNLPKVNTLTQEDSFARPDNLLEHESRAPRPLPEEISDDDPSFPDGEQPTEGNLEQGSPEQGPSPPFGGHVQAEEDMEGHYIFYRPSQGKKVLVVDRRRNECFS